MNILEWVSQALFMMKISENNVICIQCKNSDSPRNKAAGFLLIELFCEFVFFDFMGFCFVANLFFYYVPSYQACVDRFRHQPCVSSPNLRCEELEPALRGLGRPGGLRRRSKYSEN